LNYDCTNDQILLVSLLSLIRSSVFLLLLCKLERETSGGEILKGLHQEAFLKLGDLVSETNARLFFMLGWLAARRQGLGYFSGFHSETVIIAPITFSSVQDPLECHHQREECHAWLPLRRITNPTPCIGWQRCFKNNQYSFPKSQVFYYSLDLILQFKPRCLFMFLGNPVKASLVQPFTLLHFISEVFYVKRR